MDKGQELKELNRRYSKACKLSVGVDYATLAYLLVLLVVVVTTRGPWVPVMATLTIIPVTLVFVTAVVESRRYREIEQWFRDNLPTR